MLILFVRVIVLYLLVFFVLRLTGKRQLSELQPFDLVVTLLIADLASEPASNTGVPLIYRSHSGTVPAAAVYLVSFAQKRRRAQAGLRAKRGFGIPRRSAGNCAAGLSLYAVRPDGTAAQQRCF